MPAAAAPRPHVDVDRAPRPCFGLAEEHPSLRGVWHAHARHQLLYAVRGSMVLEVEGRRWTLPPQRGAIIAAGTAHRASSLAGISLRTAYVAPELLALAGVDARVFAASSLAREMLVASARWGPEDAARDAIEERTRDAFFAALAGLALEWIEEERPFALPVARTPELRRALEWIDGNLETPTVEAAARSAHVSERTLARRFEEELAMSFRAYVQAARMMRAMELLAAPGATVTETALAVGFTSMGAFTTAFAERCGETPSAYRARVGGG